MTGPARGRPFLVPVGALRRRPGARRPVRLEGPVEQLAASGSEVVPGSDVSFEGTVESTLGGVVLSGVVRAGWRGACRRCLVEAHGTLVTEVREVCVDEPDDDIGYGVGAEWLDVEPVVHDACILELPLAPLCGESCLGLCPICGANRNDETCSCGTPADSRWRQLTALGQNGETGKTGPETATGEARGSDD